MLSDVLPNFAKIGGNLRNASSSWEINLIIRAIWFCGAESMRHISLFELQPA